MPDDPHDEGRFELDGEEWEMRFEPEEEEPEFERDTREAHAACWTCGNDLDGLRCWICGILWIGGMK